MLVCVSMHPLAPAPTVQCRLAKLPGLQSTGGMQRQVLRMLLRSIGLCEQAVFCLNAAERDADAALCGGAPAVRAAACAHEQRGLLVR